MDRHHDDRAGGYDRRAHQLARKAGKLADLKADYIDKYYHTVGDDGVLRFALHQLRGDEGGTITGRFSGAAIKIGSEKIGCNPQQIPDVAKQTEKFHDPDFIIRRLIKTTVASDAAQIEYRVAADYARNPKILAAYEANPMLSFHKLTHAMLLPHKPDLSYGQLKNCNFAKLYSAGLTKLAVMLEYITPQQAESLRRQYHPKAPPKDHPLLQQAALVNEIYAREMPETKQLLERASHIVFQTVSVFTRPSTGSCRGVPLTF